MARRVLKKINTKLNFLWTQISYLNYLSRRFLCNALIQPHFDYRCTSYYPFLSKPLENKIESCSKQVHDFYLELPPCGHIKPWVRKINRLQAERRAELYTFTKYWKGIVPSSLNEMLTPSLNNYNTRSQMALHITLCRTIKGQNSMSFPGPKI